MKTNEKAEAAPAQAGSRTKAVNYCYPTSPAADRFKLKYGGYCVEIIRHTPEQQPPNIVAAFNTEAEAMRYAEGLPYPWDNIAPHPITRPQPTPPASQHTPLPWVVRNWRIESVVDGFPVCDVAERRTMSLTQANTEYIALACNAYPELLKQRNALRTALGELLNQIAETCKTRGFTDGPLVAEYEKARAALALCKEVQS